MYIVTLICFVSLILFYLEKISPRLFMLILGVSVLFTKSNIEGFGGSSSCGCSDLNSEALQNIASVYNNSSMTVTDLTVTGKLTVGDATKGTGLLTANGGIAATNVTASGTLTTTGKITATGGIATDNIYPYTANGKTSITGGIATTGDISAKNITTTNSIVAGQNITTAANIYAKTTTKVCC